MVNFVVTALSNLASGANNIDGSGDESDTYALLSPASLYNAANDFSVTNYDGGLQDFPVIDRVTFDETGRADTYDYKAQGTGSDLALSDLPTGDITWGGTSYTDVPFFISGSTSSAWSDPGGNATDLVQGDFEITSLYAVFGNTIVHVGYLSSGDTVENMTAEYPGANAAYSKNDIVAPGWNFPSVCFVRGSKIETQDGLRAIEDIKAGDMIKTLDNGFQEVRWIGFSTTVASPSNSPILFREGAIGNTEDLMVSPQHRMMISDWRAQVICGSDEVLIAAKDLVNDKDIIRVEGGSVDYFHMMFDTHEIVFAAGVPSESFHPGEANLAGMSKATRDEILALFPQLATDLDAYGSTARDCIRSYEAKAIASA